MSYHILMRDPYQIRGEFQTFYVSRETSSCPLLVDIIDFGKKISSIKLFDHSIFTISVSYGKRMVISTKQDNIAVVQSEDIVEIVDYDPIKHVLLAIGKNEPSPDAPVHWMIHHARDDINAVVQIQNNDILPRISMKLPTTKSKLSGGVIDQAKMILQTLRKGKTIGLKNMGVLSVGVNLQEIEETLVSLPGDDV